MQTNKGKKQRNKQLDKKIKKNIKKEKQTRKTKKISKQTHKKITKTFPNFDYIAHFRREILVSLLVSFWVIPCKKHKKYVEKKMVDFADSMSIISKKTTCWVIKN